MITIPSIAMIGLLAMLSMLGATILSKPWMRWAALGIAAVEIAAVAFLILIARS